MDLLGPLALWLSVVFSGPPGVLALVLPDITEPEFIRRCVQAHNAHRSRASPPAANMRLMTWDDALAKGARSWARNCKASHNPILQHVGQAHPDFRRVGENIWLGAPYSAFTVESAIHTWNQEGADYSHRNRSCARVCGHYTQLMWATSYRLGCAVHVCSGGIDNFSTHPQSTIFVCDYGDAGNVFGFPPYIVGLACSSCGKEKCQDKLCTDPTRDKPKKYDWAPGWDIIPKSSAHKCPHWLTSTGLQLFVGLCWSLYNFVTH